MKTFSIITLGCKVNQYESDAIASQLIRQGWKKTDFNHEKIDLCLVNTCAVTAKSAAQSCQEIRKLLRNHPGCRLMVTGCHAQTDPGAIRVIKGVEKIIGHRDKYKIPSMAEKNPNPSQSLITPVDHTNKNEFIYTPHAVKGKMTRAYLKIQDGCNAFCSYCIVPYARGTSVSMKPNHVMDHLGQLAKKGFKEIIFTGIHTGLYGLDLSPSTNLAEILKEIDLLRPVERIRLSSIEPTELNDELIELAKKNHILCDHFHIPLQSGNDRILNKMKRPYTGKFFADLIYKLRAQLPLASIGVDVLIGFPGETNEEFNQTYELIKDLPVSYLHVFPFSPRKGTPAFDFTPKVQPEIIKERCQKMRNLGSQKRKDFINANKGQILKGLIQHNPDSKTGELISMTSNYLKINLPWQENMGGTIVDITLDSDNTNPVKLKGKILENI